MGMLQNDSVQSEAHEEDFAHMNVAEMGLVRLNC